MRTSLRRWLLHRREQRYTGDWWHDFQRRNGCRPGWQSTYWDYIDKTITPEMCAPRPGTPTAHITRAIYQGQTLMEWDDEKRTWTMPTTRVEV